MRRGTKIYASGVFLVCIVIVIGYFALWTDRNITVYDENFKILDYSISKGPTHIFPKGNQILGRMRLKLQLQYGLKFLGGPSIVFLPGRIESLVFFVRYKGDFPFEELDGLRTVLTNDKNISKELQNLHMRDQAPQTFISFYELPKPPTSDDSFRIDFRLKSANDPVASWRVGELSKHNKGINSDQ
jgi:hypothetical protein